MTNELRAAAFQDLCLGAKFSYVRGGQVWVKIGPNLIAEWDESQVATNWVGQRVCCFRDDDVKPTDTVYLATNPADGDELVDEGWCLANGATDDGAMLLWNCPLGDQVSVCFTDALEVAQVFVNGRGVRVGEPTTRQQLRSLLAALGVV